MDSIPSKSMRLPLLQKVHCWGFPRWGKAHKSPLPDNTIPTGRTGGGHPRADGSVPTRVQVRNHDRIVTGCPVIDAIRSKSMSTARTVKPAFSAVAAIRRSRIEVPRNGVPCPRAVVVPPTARSSIAEVRYSTGSSASGGAAISSRAWLPERNEKPISRRVTVLMRTKPR